VDKTHLRKFPTESGELSDFSWIGIISELRLVLSQHTVGLTIFSEFLWKQFKSVLKCSLRAVLVYGRIHRLIYQIV